MNKYQKQVGEMLDAIGEGKPYSLEFKGTGETRIQVASSSFSIANLSDWANEIDDPAVARAIAGMLVAWAHKKEDIDLAGPEFMAAMRFFGWAGTPLNSNPINKSRETWYLRSVKMMTTETIERNLKDLQGIGNAMISNRELGPEFHDVQRAVDICVEELNRRSANV